MTKRLSPEVSKYIDMAHEEFIYAWSIDMPDPPTWTEVDIQQAIRTLVARMSAKVFVGHPTCRDPQWLDLTMNFSVDLFIAGFALRMFPPWMHFLVKPLIPARRRVQKQVDIAADMVKEFMLRREESAALGVRNSEGTLFEWMVDNAVGNEGSLKEMAARQCILTLASIHTTASTMANVLFDMIEYPEYFPVLVEEINDTIKTYGALGQNMAIKEWLQKLEKMDSFILESQRFNPPIICKSLYLPPTHEMLKPISSVAAKNYDGSPGLERRNINTNRSSYCMGRASTCIRS
jgi:ent-kaurene oxidase